MKLRETGYSTFRSDTLDPEPLIQRIGMETNDRRAVGQAPGGFPFLAR
jgi:hypothetical protein